MSNTAISKAEQNALSVAYDVLGSHVELDMPFVKRYLVRGKSDLVSDQEIVLFMNTCKTQKLNPLVAGECYLIKYSANDPAQIQVGKGAYMRRAFEHPNYLAKQDGITVRRGEAIVMKEGCCIYPGEELLGGWCRVYFERGGKERTAFKEVAMSEYNRGMANWSSKPATMINKVAISQCVREAFPKDYEGLYSEEELVASGAIPVDYEVVDDPSVDEDPVITQEQRKELFRFAKEQFGAETAPDVVKAIIDEFELASTADMTLSMYGKAMSRLNEMSNPLPPDPEPDYEAEEQPSFADEAYDLSQYE